MLTRFRNETLFVKVRVTVKSYEGRGNFRAAGTFFVIKFLV